MYVTVCLTGVESGDVECLLVGVLGLVRLILVDLDEARVLEREAAHKVGHGGDALAITKANKGQRGEESKGQL